ncbi:MAG: DUF916 domain-containing protein [Candidatus Pacebacteria bacterium]|nr:DUF916 domain-containing protein [Candidatus Paceibacterota bacterium]
MKKFYASFITLAALFAALTFSPSASALTVTPAILEISGDAGTTLVGTVRLYNESDRTQTFFTSYENFEPSDDSGTPRFIGAEDGLATWINATASVTLAPQERTEVPFTVTIPANAEPGGYFSAIFFGTQPPSPDGGIVAIGGRLGILTLLRVNGDIPEAGGVLEYDTVDGERFYTMPPVEFEFRFSNDGGDRVIPRGDIEIKNTFGQVRETILANTVEGNVLPGSARRFRTTWEANEAEPQGFFGKVKAQFNDFHFGYYTAQMNLGWGFTNQSSSNSVSFFVLPWQLLITVIAGLGLLFGILKFGGRAYRKSLMKQLEAQQAILKKEQEKIEE